MHRPSIAWGFPPLVACILAASFIGLFRADARSLPEQEKSDVLPWTTISFNPAGQQGAPELASKPQKDHLPNAEKSSLEEGPKHTAPIAKFLPWAVELVQGWKKVADSFLSCVGQWIAVSKNVAPLPPAPLMPIPNSRQVNNATCLAECDSSEKVEAPWQSASIRMRMHFCQKTLGC
jgi:hypothetical protein